MALLLCPQCFEGGGLTEVMSAEVTSRVAWCSSPDGGEPERLESGSCEIEFDGAKVVGVYCGCGWRLRDPNFTAQLLPLAPAVFMIAATIAALEAGESVRNSAISRAARTLHQTTPSPSLDARAHAIVAMLSTGTAIALDYEIEIEDLIRKTHELLTPAAAVVAEDP